MKTLQRIEIAADPVALFDLTQDYSRRLDWDPYLKEATLVGGSTAAGLGVRAWCVAWNGFGMETRYISFRRPTVCAVEMTRGPRFFRSFSGSWRFEPIGDGKTRVEFAYNLVGRPGLLTRPLMLLFALDTRRRLAALKRAVEGSG